MLTKALTNFQSTQFARSLSMQFKNQILDIPGTPLDAAPVAYTLWQRFLNYDPADPEWFNRDRFVLSAGHASMLL